MEYTVISIISFIFGVLVTINKKKDNNKEDSKVMKENIKLAEMINTQSNTIKSMELRVLNAENVCRDLRGENDKLIIMINKKENNNG